jgi:hypothetical protein
MCGRVVRITPDSILALKYQVEKVFSGLTPSHNIAPNQGIVIINDEGERQLIQCKKRIYSLLDKGLFSKYDMLRPHQVRTKKKYTNGSLLCG